MEQDLMNIFIFFFAGIILTGIITFITYKPFYNYLDNKYDFIEYNRNKNPFIHSDILGKGYGAAINNSYPLIIWTFISFFIPTIILGDLRYIWGIILFSGIIIYYVILYLRYDTFKSAFEINEYYNYRPLPKPIYDFGYTSAILLIINFCCVIFGMSRFYVYGHLTSLLLVAICLILEVVIMFTDKLNKYIPFNYTTPEEHKKLLYTCLIFVILMTALLQ